MPDWEYRLWNEDNFPISDSPQYVREAYAAKKYAFVSDYVRLWALNEWGGLYLDTDVEVLKSFENLLGQKVFIGFEESLDHLPATCVIGSVSDSQWLRDMMTLYNGIHFRATDGTLDLTTNVRRLGDLMTANGLIPNGKYQIVSKWELSVYPHDYFSPLTSTRVMRKTKNTYCIHRFAGSWSDSEKTCFKGNAVIREFINAMVQIKRVLKKAIG